MAKFLDPLEAQKMYKEFLAKGYDKKSASKQTQDLTGISTVSWKPMKSRGGVEQRVAGITTSPVFKSSSGGML